MLLYTGQLRIGGSVSLRLNNFLLLFSLIVAVLISAIVRFHGRERYFAVLVVGFALAAFHIAGGGILNPRNVLHLFKTSRLQKKAPGLD